MKYKILFSVYLVFTIILGGILLINVIEYNTLSQKLDNKKVVFSLFPQGWAFFTRNPREGQVILYQKEKGELKKLPFQHHNHKYIFGLNRRTTKIYTELGYIKSKISDNLFKSVKWNYQSEIYQKDLSGLNRVSIQPPLQENILNGEYLLVIQEPIPWAWSNQSHKIKMPAMAIFINVKN